MRHDSVVPIDEVTAMSERSAVERCGYSSGLKIRGGPSGGRRVPLDPEGPKTVRLIKIVRTLSIWRMLNSEG